MIKLIPPGTKPSLTTTGSALLASALLGSVPMTTYAYDSPVHIFSVNDVMGGFDGSTYGPAGAVPDQTNIICGLTDTCPTGIAPVTDKQGVTLYPVDSEFGFYVVDFLGAATKSKDGDYNEGFVGNIESGGSVVGLKISNTATDTYKVKPPLGTWCQGLGGTSVKCSTEHYTVMEHVLTCHEVVPYRFADPLTGEQAVLGFPPGVVNPPPPLDCSDAALDDNLTIIGNGQLTNVTPGVQMEANDNTTVLADIAVSEDYSVTLKDDGKPLYRWGGLIKRPNDIRLYARLALPEEWKVADADFQVTRAHLIVNHWITNNPNDQLRPEDLENEAATGRKPSYEIDSEGNWTSTRSCYEGDGDLIDEEGAPAPDFLATGTYFKNVRDSVEEGDPLPFSSDLIEGFTNAYYTTIERDPFEWSYNTSTDPLVKQFVGSLLPNDSLGELVSGPRWRLRANKFGQDIPGLEIPAIECSEPPFTSENIKYEVGEPATTVINLLDWDEEANDAPSPLSTSRGWVDVSANQFVEVATEASGGTPVTTNGLPMTDDFDLAVYIKGDRKSTALFSAQLQIEYEGEGPVNGNDYDVSITAFAAPERVLLGEASTVSVTLSNSGPAVADGAVSILGTTNRGEVIGPFMEMFDGLIPGNPITLELPWTAPADKVTTITFDASVMASGDINPTNNEASAQTKVRRN
ncbi:MAG: hypothetical protein HKN42_12240 [Granulosicoccus sp.]|nr:hypothetical protein [Granulosicoccus sp.]